MPDTDTETQVAELRELRERTARLLKACAEGTAELVDRLAGASRPTRAALKAPKPIARARPPAERSPHPTRW